MTEIIFEPHSEIGETMIVVIFEVYPKEDHKDQYLDIAADIRPMLEEVDGFISVERFQSLNDPSKLLSISFFENEEAVQQWRQLSEHRKAQRYGRAEIFKDYRIRVAHVMRDYGMLEREQVPDDSKIEHDT